MIIASFSSYIVSFYTCNLDATKRAAKTALLSITVSLSSAILSIGFVYFAKYNKAIVQIYSKSFPSILISIILFVLIYSKGKKLYDKKYWCFALTLTLH